MKLTDKNQRVFYWTIIGMVLASYLALYSHYTYLEEVLDHSTEKSNRQLSITVDHWYQQILMRDEKIRLLEQHIVEMEERGN